MNNRFLKLALLGIILLSATFFFVALILDVTVPKLLYIMLLNSKTSFTSSDYIVDFNIVYIITVLTGVTGALILKRIQ